MKAFLSCENAGARATSQDHAKETGFYCHNWEAIVKLCKFSIAELQSATSLGRCLEKQWQSAHRGTEEKGHCESYERRRQPERQRTVEGTQRRLRQAKRDPGCINHGGREGIRVSQV